MIARRRSLFLVAFMALLSGAGAAPAPVSEPARLVVQNDTYSSLTVLMHDGAGETQLGQAPPSFANTLVIREPLPAGRVRFHARLAGEREALYRSPEVTLSPGARLRWRLPENVIE